MDQNKGEFLPCLAAHKNSGLEPAKIVLSESAVLVFNVLRQGNIYAPHMCNTCEYSVLLYTYHHLGSTWLHLYYTWGAIIVTPDPPVPELFARGRANGKLVEFVDGIKFPILPSTYR